MGILLQKKDLKKVPTRAPSRNLKATELLQLERPLRFDKDENCQTPYVKAIYPIFPFQNISSIPPKALHRGDAFLRRLNYAFLRPSNALSDRHGRNFFSFPIHTNRPLSDLVAISGWGR